MSLQTRRLTAKIFHLHYFGQNCTLLKFSRELFLTNEKIAFQYWKIIAETGDIFQLWPFARARPGPLYTFCERDQSQLWLRFEHSQPYITQSAAYTLKQSIQHCLMLPLDHHLTSPNKEDPTAMMLYYSDEKVDFLIHKQKLVFLGFHAVLEMTIINKCQVISGCLHFEKEASLILF